VEDICGAGERMKKDLTNMIFGRLTAIAPTDQRKHGCVIWECRCSCKKQKTVYARSDNLLSGKTQSCGCLHVESALERSKTVRDNNLIDGTNVGNIRKNKAPRHNTSGYRGITWHKGTGMWQARIQFQGIMHHLGYRKDIDKAIELRKDAELKYFGKYLK